MRISGWEKTASSAAMVIWQDRASQEPAPMHQPLTAEMTGMPSSQR